MMKDSAKIDGIHTFFGKGKFRERLVIAWFFVPFFRLRLSVFSLECVGYSLARKMTSGCPSVIVFT